LQLNEDGAPKIFVGKLEDGSLKHLWFNKDGAQKILTGKQDDVALNTCS